MAYVHPVHRSQSEDVIADLEQNNDERRCMVGRVLVFAARKNPDAKACELIRDEPAFAKLACRRVYIHF